MQGIGTSTERTPTPPPPQENEVTTVVNSDAYLVEETVDPSHDTQDLETAEEWTPAAKSEGSQPSSWLVFTVGILCMVGIFLAVMFGVILKTDKKENQDHPFSLPTDQQIYPPFDSGLPKVVLDAINTAGSPQNRANIWMHNDPYLDTYSQWQRIQRFGMVTFYYSTGGDNWYRNDHWLSYDISECQWFLDQELCDGEGQLVSLDLSSNNLNGTLAQEVIVPSMLLVNVSHNNIHGHFPVMYFPLDLRMEVIDLSHNRIVGSPTVKLGYFSPKVRVLKINNNQMDGHFLHGTHYSFPQPGDPRRQCQQV